MAKSLFVARILPILRLSGIADVVKEVKRVAFLKHEIIFHVFAFAGKLAHLARGRCVFRGGKNQPAERCDVVLWFEFDHNLVVLSRIFDLPEIPIGLAVGHACAAGGHHFRRLAIATAQFH